MGECVSLKIEDWSKFAFKMRLSQAFRYWANHAGKPTGTRMDQNATSGLKGLSGSGLNGFKDPALAPLFIIMTGAVTFCTWFCCRSLFTCPDVDWQKHTETPQDYYMRKQYKFYNARNVDFDPQCQAPKY